MSKNTYPSELLLFEYSKYAKEVAEGDRMAFDDWLAGSDLPEIVEARELAKAKERNRGKTAFYFFPTIGSRVSVETTKGTEEGVVTRHDWKEGIPIFYYDQVTFLEGAVVEKDKWAWLEQLLSMSF